MRPCAAAARPATLAALELQACAVTAAPSPQRFQSARLGSRVGGIEAPARPVCLAFPSAPAKRGLPKGNSAASMRCKPKSRLAPHGRAYFIRARQGQALRARVPRGLDPITQRAHSTFLAAARPAAKKKTLLCRRPRMRKCASTTNCSPSRRVDFFISPQIRARLQENDCRYDQTASGGLLGGVNLYLYAKAAPTMYTDPDGLTPLGVAIGIGVRAIGGGAATGAIGAGARSLLGPTVGGIAACVLAGVCSASDPGSDDAGAGVRAGAGTGSSAQSCQPDDKCEEQAKKDEQMCRMTTMPRTGARARCWASVQERYGACKAGRPLPPLVTW